MRDNISQEDKARLFDEIQSIAKTHQWLDQQRPWRRQEYRSQRAFVDAVLKILGEEVAYGNHC